MIAVVVPIKAGAQVKSRLSDILSPEERRGLGLAMAADVLATLGKVSALQRHLLVTGDAEATALAGSAGFTVMPEPEPVGYRSAAQAAMAQLAAEGVTAALCLPADLPLLTVGDVEALIAAIGEAPAAVLAPSRDEGGTNALALAPPDLMSLRFGPDSFHLHERQARAAGVRPSVLRRPNLALDIDTGDDLRALIAQGPTGRTGDYLEQSGIIRRIENYGARTGISG